MVSPQPGIHRVSPLNPTTFDSQKEFNAKGKWQKRLRLSRLLRLLRFIFWLWVSFLASIYNRMDQNYPQFLVILSGFQVQYRYHFRLDCPLPLSPNRLKYNVLALEQRIFVL